MFEILCLLLAFTAVCHGASIGRVDATTTEKKEIIPVLKFETDKKADGSFHFMYEGGDQSFREETGVVENAGTDDEALEVSGSYRYIDADGREVEVHYTAGKNGFVPVGTNILSEISALAKSAADLPTPAEELEAKLSQRKARSKIVEPENNIPVKIVEEKKPVKVAEKKPIKEAEKKPVTKKTEEKKEEVKKVEEKKPTARQIVENKDEHKKEEPKKEEPKKEGTTKEEPLKEETKKEEPKKDEPKKEEPMKEEPKKEEAPKKRETKSTEPTTEEKKETSKVPKPMVQIKEETKPKEEETKKEVEKEQPKTAEKKEASKTEVKRETKPAAPTTEEKKESSKVPKPMVQIKEETKPIKIETLKTVIA